MTTETATAQDRLGEWATGGNRSVLIRCRYEHYESRFAVWYVEAERTALGTEVVVEAGPCPDVETACQMVIERLAEAGVVVA